MKSSLAISNFLENITVFHIPLFSPISLHWSLRKAFLPLLAILWNSAFKWVFLFLLCLSLLFFSKLFMRPPHIIILPFFHFLFLGWSWSLPPVQCSKLLSIVLQALFLSDPLPWIYFSLPVYNCKVFDLDHYAWSNGFPYFLQFKSEFGNKEFRIWATVCSRSCFPDCIELLHLWLQRI